MESLPAILKKLKEHDNFGGDPEKIAEVMAHRQNLSKVLDYEIGLQMKLALDSTPKHVVLSRIIDVVSEAIEFPKEISMPDYKTTLHLDANTKAMIVETWLSQGDLKLNYDELDRILSHDYHKPSTLARFANILLRRECARKDGPSSSSSSSSPPPPSHPLNPRLLELFAMDGSCEEEPIRYVDHLRRGSDFRSKHLNAVRHLYRTGMAERPEEIWNAMQSAFDVRPCTTTTSSREEELKEMYEALVGDDLPLIREWKLRPSEEPVKKRGRKGKEGSGSEPSRKRKSKPGEEESGSGGGGGDGGGGEDDDSTKPSVPENKRKRIRKNPTPLRVGELSETLTKSENESDDATRPSVPEKTKKRIRKNSTPVRAGGLSETLTKSENESDDATRPSDPEKKKKRIRKNPLPVKIEECQEPSETIPETPPETPTETRKKSEDEEDDSTTSE